MISYPKTRKPRVMAEGWVSPNKGRAKPIIDKTCKQCSGTFRGYPGNAYCSTQCQLGANIDKSNADGCWLWTGYIRPGGYGEAYFGQKPNRVRLLAHRAVYEAFVGDPAGKVVCHRCDNPGCVRVDHLFLGTIADNTRDRDQKGRQARGERNGPAKLTESQVRAIRADARGVRKLSKAYGVAQTTIGSIKKRKTWKHVE